MESVTTSGTAIKHVLAVSEGEAGRCVLHTDNGKLLSTRSSGEVVAELGPMPACRFAPTLSRSSGGEFFWTYDGQIAHIISSWSGEEVCQVPTKTSRFVVGEQTVSWVCKEGVKSCMIGIPQFPILVAASEIPCRIAYCFDDTLVVLWIEGKRVWLELIDCASKDWSHSTSRTNKRRCLAPVPSNVGPLHVSKAGVVSFLYYSLNKLAVGHASLHGDLTVKSLPIKTPMLNDGELHDVLVSQSIIKPSGMIYSLIHHHLQDMTRSANLIIQRGSKVVALKASKDHFLACDGKDGAWLFNPLNGQSVVVNGIATGTDRVARIGQRFINVGRRRQCQTCRRFVTKADVGKISCKACRTPGTSAFAFGVALEYVRNKYKWLPTDEEAAALRLLWSNNPRCVWRGLPYTTTKLVFNKIMSSYPVEGSNLMIVNRSYRDAPVPRNVQLIAKRRYEQALSAVREEMSKRT